jgi:glycoprotein 3-alpha-L-fucosyltransferase
MGAPRSDYEQLAPPESFIHVDDFSTPQELADFLLQLIADKERYNSYFRWKGSGEYIDTKYWCRLCAMLHEARRTEYHSIFYRLNDWWRGPGVCIDPQPDGLGYATWRKGARMGNTSFHQQWTEKPHDTVKTTGLQ